MSRPVLIVLAALAASIALALGFAVESLFEVVWAQVVFIVAVEVVLFVIALAIRPEKKLPFLCDPVVLFVGFQAQFFVVGPLAFPYSTFYSETPIPTELIVLTVLGFIALLTMFLVGYHLPFGSGLATLLPTFEGGRSKLPGRWAERGLLVACLAACAGYISFQGGALAMVSRGYGGGESGAIFTAAFLMLVLTTCLMAWNVFGSARRSRADVMLFVAVLGFEVLFWGILLGQRKWLFHIFFGVTAVFILRRGMRAVPRLLLPTVMVLLVVYLSIWGSVRGRPVAAFMQEYDDPRQARTESLYRGYTEGVAGPFGAACLTLQVFPDVEPYRYGKTLLVALLSPIPRAVWPGKPVGLGKELTWYLGSYYAMSYDPTKGLSITPTLVGDFYANLGVFGILLGGLCFGITCRVVAAYAVKGMRDGLQTRPARVLIPAVFLAGLVELRADSAMLTLFYMYTLLPLLALLAFFSFEPAKSKGALTQA